MAEAYGGERWSIEARGAFERLERELGGVLAGLSGIVPRYLRAALKYYLENGHVNAPESKPVVLADGPVNLGKWLTNLRRDQGAGRGLVERFLTALSWGDEEAGRAARELLAKRWGSRAEAVADAYDRAPNSNETHRAIEAFKGDLDIGWDGPSGQVAGHLRAALAHYLENNGDVNAPVRTKLGRWQEDLRSRPGLKRELAWRSMRALGMRRPDARVLPGDGAGPAASVEQPAMSGGEGGDADPSYVIHPGAAVPGSAGGTGAEEAGGYFGPYMPVGDGLPGEVLSLDDGVFHGGVGPMDPFDPLYRGEDWPVWPFGPGGAQASELGLAPDVGPPMFGQDVQPDEASRPHFVQGDVIQPGPMDQTGLEFFDGTAPHEPMEVDQPGGNGGESFIERAGLSGPDTGNPPRSYLDILDDLDDQEVTDFLFGRSVPDDTEVESWIHGEGGQQGLPREDDPALREEDALRSQDDDAQNGNAGGQGDVAEEFRNLKALAEKVATAYRPQDSQSEVSRKTAVDELDQALKGIQTNHRDADQRSAALNLRAALYYFAAHGTVNAPRHEPPVLVGDERVGLGVWLNNFRDPRKYGSVRSWVAPVLSELGMRWRTSRVPVGGAQGRASSAGRLVTSGDASVRSGRSGASGRVGSAAVRPVREARLVRDPLAPVDDPKHPEWDLTGREWELIEASLGRSFRRDPRRHFDALMYRARNSLSMSSGVPRARYGPARASYDMFREWAQAGVLGQVVDSVRDNPEAHDVVREAVKAVFGAAQDYLNGRGLRALLSETVDDAQPPAQGNSDGNGAQ
ncbi:hypothetical protein [Streptomyces sp. NPDC052036]|uniref:hypothetical protein n=1 Tax=Streptomyces sp. NPDC052036 TaxID=3155171 RepID=UPI00342B4926